VLCAGLSWPYRQLLNAHKYIVSYYIFFFIRHQTRREAGLVSSCKLSDAGIFYSVYQQAKNAKACKREDFGESEQKSTWTEHLCKMLITNFAVFSGEQVIKDGGPHVHGTLAPAYRTDSIHHVLVRRRPSDLASKIGIGQRTHELLRRVAPRLMAMHSKPLKLWVKLIHSRGSETEQITNHAIHLHPHA